MFKQKKQLTNIEIAKLLEEKHAAHMITYGKLVAAVQEAARFYKISIPSNDMEHNYHKVLTKIYELYGKETILDPK